MKFRNFKCLTIPDKENPVKGEGRS